jgi:hypothetical protein
MTIHFPLTVTPESATAFSLECEGRKLVHFQETGKLARLLNPDADEFANHDLVRWAAPFALAPQGLVCLHASGVHKDGITVGFVGIGGAGKSTLAHEFSRHGWEIIADDLMVCDAEDRVNALAERILRQWCEIKAAQHETSEVSQTSEVLSSWIDYTDLARKLADANNQHWLPISGLCFVDEFRGENLAVRPLSGGDQFSRLVRFGFGGLPTAEAWAHQFQVYSTLAGRVPAAILQLPEGLDQLRYALPQLEDSLSQWLNDRARIHS